MQIKAVIDRFENDKAVLLVGDEEIAVNWLKRFLPEKVKEGDYVQLTIVFDAETTAAARAEAAELLSSITEKER